MIKANDNKDVIAPSMKAFEMADKFYASTRGMNEADHRYALAGLIELACDMAIAKTIETMEALKSKGRV